MYVVIVEPVVIAKFVLMECKRGLFRASFGDRRVSVASLLTVVNCMVPSGRTVLGIVDRQHCRCQKLRGLE